MRSCNPNLGTNALPFQMADITDSHNTSMPDDIIDETLSHPRVLDDSINDVASKEQRRGSESSSRDSDNKLGVLDDSDDEGGLYSNYLKNYVPNYTRVEQIEADATFAAPASPDSPQPKRRRSFDLSDDDELSDVDAEEESIFNKLKKKAAKSAAEVKASQRRDAEEIEKIARVRDALPGALPKNYYSCNHIEKAQRTIRHMTDANARMMDISPLRPISSMRASAPSRPAEPVGPQCSIILFDLEGSKGQTKDWSMSRPLTQLRTDIAAKWGCTEEEVLILMNQKTIEVELSPEQLHFSETALNKLSAMRIAVAAPSFSTSRVNEQPVDPNKITVRLQRSSGRPVNLQILKAESFASQMAAIEAALGGVSVKKLLFDNDSVDFACSPNDLDMDEEDCIDVHC